MTPSNVSLTTEEFKLNEARLDSLLRIINHRCETNQELLDFALSESIMLTHSTIGYIYRYDEQTKHFTLNSWSTEVMKQCMIVDKKVTYHLDATGIWGEAVRQRKPILINDFSAPDPLKKGMPAGHAPLHRFLTLPVVINEQIVAVIGVANKTEPYTEADIRQLTLLMDSVWKIVASKQYEETLLRKERMLSSVCKMASVGGWELDGSTMKLTWTDEVYRIHEVDLDNVLTLENAINFYAPESRPVITEAVQNAFEKGVPFDVTLSIITGKGNKRYVHSIGEAYDTGAATKTILGTFQDITERKRLTEELQKIQKLESLGILAGGIAHDFNNLLGGVYGFIDLAFENTKEEKVLSFLSRAKTSISRGRDLTRQLITFAHGGDLIRKVGVPGSFIRETAQFALSGTNVSLNVDLPDDLYAINYDQNQIGQVIDNIIINAKQAMPEGGTIELTVKNLDIGQSTPATLPKGKFVEISIKDQGVGIPKEIMPRIFDPFFTTKPSGHGLGLATSYSIVKQHEGTIVAESQPGQGSTFRILLPAADRAVESEQHDKTHLFSGRGILIIMDDDETMRMVMNEMFTSMGFTVLCTINSQETIDLFCSAVQNRQEIKGAFFDLTIPGCKGGKETVAEVRKLLPELPIFAVSGHSTDPVIAHPQTYGFTGSIRKPFLKSEVMELLDRFFSETPQSPWS